MRRLITGIAPWRSWFCAIVLAAVAAASGCSDDAEGVSVAGSVAYQDKPISSAALTFYPAAGRPVTATVSDGAYECKLPPGEYRVTVAVGVTLPEGWKEGDPVPPLAIELPAKFSSRLNTPLAASVTADGGKQTINFPLTE